MKTLFTILILIATVTFSHAADQKENKQEFTIDQAELNQVQDDLLQNYLQKENIEWDNVQEPKVLIYNLEGEIVFSGIESEAADLINQSALLTEYQNVKTFSLIK